MCTCVSENWPAAVWEWAWSWHWCSLWIGWLLSHVTVWPALIGCLLELSFFGPSPSPVPYAPLEGCRSLPSVPGRLADRLESESTTYTNKHFKLHHNPQWTEMIHLHTNEWRYQPCRLMIECKPACLRVQNPTVFIRIKHSPCTANNKRTILLIYYVLELVVSK